MGKPFSINTSRYVSIPVVLFSALPGHQHNPGCGPEQGHGTQALLRSNRIQRRRERHHPEGTRPDEVRADHPGARHHA